MNWASALHHTKCQDQHKHSIWWPYTVLVAKTEQLPGSPLSTAPYCWRPRPWWGAWCGRCRGGTGGLSSRRPLLATVCWFFTLSDRVLLSSLSPKSKATGCLNVTVNKKKNKWDWYHFFVNDYENKDGRKTSLNYFNDSKIVFEWEMIRPLFLHQATNSARKDRTGLKGQTG